MTAEQTDAAKTHRPCPIPLAEFARRAGRARSSITEAFQGPLAPAKLPGGRADAAHAAVVAWCQQRGIEHAALVAVVAASPASAAPASPMAVPTRSAPLAPQPAASRPPRAEAVSDLGAQPDASELAELTVRQIVQRHGSVPAFADFVALRKDIASTHRIELQNEESKGHLISRDLVRTHVFGAIESANRRLLQDAPRTIGLRVAGALKSGESTEQIERLVRDIIGQNLRLVKTTASRILRGDSKVDADE